MTDPTSPERIVPGERPLQPPAAPIEDPMGVPPRPTLPMEDPAPEEPMRAPGEPPDRATFK